MSGAGPAFAPKPTLFAAKPGCCPPSWSQSTLRATHTSRVTLGDASRCGPLSCRGSSEGSGRDWGAEVTTPRPCPPSPASSFPVSWATRVSAPCSPLSVTCLVLCQLTDLRAPHSRADTHAWISEDPCVLSSLRTPRSPRWDHTSRLPTLGHTRGPRAGCRAREYFMPGDAAGFSRSHASHPPSHRLLVYLFNELFIPGPLPAWPPPPPGPSLHDLLNTAQLRSCHPKSQEQPWATQPEYSLHPRPV